MVRLAVIFVLSTLFSMQAWSVAFESSVDRTDVGEGETLVLTVRYNANVFSNSPNFKPLTPQFRVVNQSRKSSFQFINGKSETWTVWTLNLIPKRKGKLIIPSLTFEGEKTQPIQINVSAVSSHLKSKDEEVFFATQVDNKTTYVQSHVVYSEKLYFSIPLENGELSKLEVDEAVVTPLGDIKQYRTQLNGRTYNVYERQFAIAPQASGEMIIPGPRYSGEVSNGPWRPGRPISLSHGPQRVSVLPKPASYPNATWLPAKSLDADFAWQGDPNSITLGDPITFTMTLKADGLGSAQLPAIAIPEINGIKYYPDQAQTDDETSSQGIRSERRQSIALVATESGTFTLPEIRIPWWNIRLQKLEYATIPPQTFTVTSAAGNTGQSRSESPSQNSDANQASANESLSASGNKISQNNSTGFNPWILSTLILAILWLATLYFLLWKHNQGQLNIKLKNEPNSQSSLGKQVSKPLKKLKQACRNNQPEQARQALLEWGSDTLKNGPITQLSELTTLINDTSLAQAINELDYTLYSQAGSSAWQGEFLWQLVNQYKHHQSQHQNDANGLRPLYPVDK